MKPGDLVKILRPSLGVPEGSIGLIINLCEVERYGPMADIQLCNAKQPRQPGESIRRLRRDLEVISENR